MHLCVFAKIGRIVRDSADGTMGRWRRRAAAHKTAKTLWNENNYDFHFIRSSCYLSADSQIDPIIVIRLAAKAAKINIRFGQQFRAEWK